MNRCCKIGKYLWFPRERELKYVDPEISITYLVRTCIFCGTPSGTLESQRLTGATLGFGTTQRARYT